MTQPRMIARLPMYIDPTAGSLVLQVLAAAALSAVAMVGRVREGVKSFFKSFTKR